MMLQIMEIKDFNAPELDVYARLTENQLLNRHEPEKGIFIAESPKVIERALDGGCIPLSFLVEHRHLETQARELLERCPEVPVYTAEFDVLTQLTGFKLTRGMLCAMRRPGLPKPEEICRRAKRLVILENVVNPTNVGAIFRSAAALYMDGILLTAGCRPGRKSSAPDCSTTSDEEWSTTTAAFHTFCRTENVILSEIMSS